MKHGGAWSRTRWFMIALVSISQAGLAAGESLWISAVKKQDQAAMRELIEKKVDVNESQADGATALHWAVHRDDLATAKLLIEAGANVNVANDFGIVPLSLACVNRNASMAETLLKAGADSNARLMTGESMLMTAAHAGDLETVNILIAHGAELNAKEPIRGQTALMWALSEKHTDVTRRLIEQGADIHAATTLGFTPLLFAAREGDLEAAELLLDAGADVNALALPEGSQTYLADRSDEAKKKIREEDEGLSVLHVATLRGHGEVAALLLERGADPNYMGPGYTALHWAVTSWETELNGVNGMRAPKEHEWHRMAGVKEGKLELVKALLEHGANPNARLKKNPSRFGFTVASTRPAGATPYVLAAMTGDAEIMRLLVERGANPSLKPSNGVPALLWAAGVGRHRAENIASEDASLAAVKVALENGAKVDDRDRNENTALHGAAWIRSTKLVQYLVDRGADVHALNKQKQSPLYIAMRDGRFAGIRGPIIEDSPTVNLLRELSVPPVVKESIEKWGTLPSHVRKAVELLLQGELEAIEDAKKKNEKK